MNPTYNNTLLIVLVFLLLFSGGEALRPYHFSPHSRVAKNHIHAKGGEIGMELYPTGSSLPDCSHACGACNPCLRVMVSFSKCAVESCPVVYRCMCRGRYYHVPSN